MCRLIYKVAMQIEANRLARDQQTGRYATDAAPVVLPSPSASVAPAQRSLYIDLTGDEQEEGGNPSVTPVVASPVAVVASSSLFPLSESQASQRSEQPVEPNLRQQQDRQVSVAVASGGRRAVSSRRPPPPPPPRPSPSPSPSSLLSQPFAPSFAPSPSPTGAASASASTLLSHQPLPAHQGYQQNKHQQKPQGHRGGAQHRRPASGVPAPVGPPRRALKFRAPETPETMEARSKKAGKKTRK